MGKGYVNPIFGLILKILLQVRMCLVVIGGEISKKEMVFLFRSRESSFLQNNMNRHRQTT